MSRAMNITLTEDETVAVCAKAGVAISAIEALPDGGTRLVCARSDDAEVIRRKLAGHMIAGAVRRYRFYSLRAG